MLPFGLKAVDSRLPGGGLAANRAAAAPSQVAAGDRGCGLRQAFVNAIPPMSEPQTLNVMEWI